MDKPLYVTQPSLAPLDELCENLASVWESRILTHNGPFVQEFEKRMCQHLGVSNFVAVTNGTIALQMAIKALEIKGEIITTPFTWVATISAIKWEGCTPVFCDIDPDTLNIDPDKIQEKITSKTVAIMPVHVFGNPCDIDKIEKIAKENNLKVIYDAAHAIGSRYQGKSVLAYGDVSATSLHATKIINTGEGGACVSTDDALKEKLERIRFFGFDEDKNIVEDGFNGKMSEIHAALGVANIKYLDDVLSKRKSMYMQYKELLSDVYDLRCQELRYGDCNYSYFPIILKSEALLHKVVEKMNEVNVFPRRYFYPSVNTLTNIVKHISMPISESVSDRVLCLPLHFDMSEADVGEVSEIVRRVLN